MYYLNIIILILVIFLLYQVMSVKEPFDINQPKLAIQTVFLPKENNIFLEEWIDYHLNLGFDKIYLYNNDGSKGVPSFHKDLVKNKKNKYNIDYKSLLGDHNIDAELKYLEDKYKNKIKIIRWDYRNDKNEIIYGQMQSMTHYKNNFGSENDWTAFIDVDEFIYLDPKLGSLKDYIKQHDNNGITKLVIKQKKYADRFCNLDKSTMDIDDVIEINTNGWGIKNICKNNQILDKQHSPHDISLKNNKQKNCNQDELRFNHYNINIKQIDWMKGFFRTDKFKSGKDHSMKKFKTPLCEKINQERKYNKQFFQENKNKYCYQFN